MKLSLRLRFFFWLLLLLVIFMMVQTLVYGLVEMMTIARNPELSVREQLEEVIMGVGFDLLLLPLLAIAAWWISSRMIRPIRTLATTANLIGAGQLEQRVNVESMPDDEMRMLAQVLNQAFDRYRHAMNNIDRFTGDASHQLRTPLASMRLTAEVALSGGVWQNITLLGRTLSLLRNDGFKVYIHQEVPTNDGGLSLGQAVIAATKMRG